MNLLINTSPNNQIWCPESLILKVYNWLGKENVRWFKHIKGLKGEVNAVLKLNQKRKGIPAHPIHFREGMRIRNFMRLQEECEGWNSIDFDCAWVFVVEQCIKLLNNELTTESN